jgi:hypothetical protein
MDKSTVAAVLFAVGAGAAAWSAIRSDVERRVNLFEAGVATAVAGLFVLVQNLVK